MLMSRPTAATPWASRRTRECGDCFRHRSTNRWTYPRTRNALSNLEKRSRKNFCRHRRHMGFEGTLIYLGHRQVGSLPKPLIAWPFQPSGSMPSKRVIHQLLKGNSSTSQISWIVFGLNVRPIGCLCGLGDLRHPVGNERCRWFG